MRRSLCLFIILLYCSYTPPGYASEGLSLSAALKTAFDQSPRMVQAMAALKAARAQQGIAARWENPQVEIEPDRISVKQPFDPLGVKHLKGRIARNTALLEEQLLRDTWAELYVEVREAYMGVLLAEKRHELQQQDLKAMRQFFGHVQMQYQSGRVSSHQMQRSRIELLSTQGAALKAVSERDIARARLNMLLGRPRGSVLELTDTFDREYQRIALEELTAQALVDSPKAQGQRLRLESAGYVLRQERLSRLPSFAFGLAQSNQKDDDDADHNTAFLLELSVPLWTAFNQGAVTKAKAEREQEASRLQETLSRLDFDIYRLYQQVELSLAQADLAHKASKAAEEMFTLASVRYQEGDLSFMEYLEQFKASMQARAGYYDALYALDHHISELERTAHRSLKKEGLFK